MTGMTMINDAALETIVGGAVRTVKNTSVRVLRAESLARSATAARSTQPARESTRTVTHGTRSPSRAARAGSQEACLVFN